MGGRELGTWLLGGRIEFLEVRVLFDPTTTGLCLIVSGRTAAVPAAGYIKPQSYVSLGNSRCVPLFGLLQTPHKKLQNDVPI